MRVEITLGGQGGRRARPEGLGASCQEAGGRECVEVATHPHAVLVNMHPVAVVRAMYLTDIASDNDHLPGLRIVIVILEVSVDICLGLQPRCEERTVAGACLLQDVGGQESRSYLLRVDAVFNAVEVLFVVIVEDCAHFDTLGAVPATSGAE